MKKKVVLLFCLFYLVPFPLLKSFGNQNSIRRQILVSESRVLITGQQDIFGLVPINIALPVLKRVGQQAPTEVDANFYPFFCLMQNMAGAKIGSSS